MTRTNAKDYSEGDEIAIARLDSWTERFDYMRRFLTLDECINVYSRALLRGVQAWLTLLRGTGAIDYADRGFYGKKATDIRLMPEEAAIMHHSDIISLEDYQQENINQLRAIVNTCRQMGAEPVFLVLPISDSSLWKKSEMDSFRQWLKGFSAEMGCTCYDFNLFRDRYSIFSDEVSYTSGTHMSVTGARAFTAAFAEVMAMVERGENVDDLFYPSYEEMLLDSPYQP